MDAGTRLDLALMTTDDIQTTATETAVNGATGGTRVKRGMADIAHQGRFSLGCYCAEEARCHRSVLRALLSEAGARIAD